MAHSNRLAKRYLSELTQVPDDLSKHGFEGLLRYLDANSPLHERLGYSISLKQDGFRLGQTPLMHFHASAFTAVEQQSQSGLYKLNNAYWGLFGINGPLPAHLTEYAIERDYRHKDKTLVAFCDLFHHRFIALFYRAWAAAQPAVNHDFALLNNDKFAQRLRVFSGSNTPSTSTPEKIAKSQKAALNEYQYQQLETYLTGLLSAKSRSPATLTQAIQSYLGHQVKLQEFVGCWFDIPASEQTRLGQANNKLGCTTVMGKSSFQRSFNIAIHIGPLSFEQYSELLNDPEHFNVIRRLAHKVLGSEFAISIHLQLAANQKKRAGLGHCALGRNSWIASRSDSDSQAHTAFSTTG